jgi:kumamolisin
MPNLFHKAPNTAVYLGESDGAERIKIRVEMRRKLDHEPIPDFDAFVGCPRRERLSNDAFAAKYGADPQEMAAVSSYCQTFGLTTILHHAARRHVEIEGTVSQFNAAFGIELKHYEKQHGKNRIVFRSHETPAQVPDHLHSMIIDVRGLSNEPLAIPPAYPPPVHGAVAPSLINAVYNVPAVSATNQTIGICILPGWGQYLTTDIQATCTLYGLTVPTIQTVIVDTISLGTDAESTLDVSMCVLFGGGAKVAPYQGNNIYDIIARMTFPNTGDPIVNVVTISAGVNENNINLNDLTFQDAALQGITCFSSSGDWGPTDSNGMIAALWPAVSPWCTGVGGTVIGAASGTTSSSNFVEWFWNDNQTFYYVGGGGVSVFFPLPSYQSSSNVPHTLTTAFTGTLGGAQGAGSPDLAANAAGDNSPINIYFNGSIVPGGGTSQSSPLMAGIFARVNAYLGFNLGYINPSLYAAPSNCTRQVNTGGPTNNTMIGSGTSPPTFVGYNVSTTGWNPCTGLGTINATNFATYITTQTYYIVVEAINSFGISVASATLGPYSPPPPQVTGVTATNPSLNSVAVVWNALSGALPVTYTVYYSTSPTGPFTVAASGVTTPSATITV